MSNTIDSAVNASSRHVYIYYPAPNRNSYPTYLNTEVTPYKIYRVDEYSDLSSFHLKYCDSKIIVVNDHVYNYSLHIQIKNYRIINVYCLNFTRNDLIDRYNICNYIKSINEVYFENALDLFLLKEVIDTNFKEINIYDHLSDYHITNTFSGYNKSQLSISFTINDLSFMLYHKFSYEQFIDKEPIDIIKSQLLSLIKKVNLIKEIEKIDRNKIDKLKSVLPSFSNIRFSTKLEGKKLIELITNIGEYPLLNDDIIKRISKGISKCNEYVISEELRNQQKSSSNISININLQYGIRYILNREYHSENNSFSDSINSFFLICGNILPISYERCTSLGELFGEEFLIDFYEKLEYNFLKGVT